MITSLDQLDLNGTYSYADYYQWRLKDFIRVELIKGKISKIPSTNVQHQMVSGQIAGRLYNFFKSTNKDYDVFHAPLDVRLSSLKDQPDELVFNVVQPDLMVFCNPSNLDDRGGIGAPDLAVEILITGKAKTELSEKFALYQQFGVKEYWLVEPTYEMILVYVLNQEGKFIGLRPYTTEDTFASNLFPEFNFEVANIFESYNNLRAKIGQ